VGSKIQALEVELQAPPRAQVIEEAAIAETPRWEKMMASLAGPPVAAFVAVLLLVAWLDVRRGRVDGADDLEAGRVRVLGAIPLVRGHLLNTFSPPARSGARREYHRLADAVQMARAVLTPVLASSHVYTLAVTSAA